MWSWRLTRTGSSVNKKPTICIRSATEVRTPAALCMYTSHSRSSISARQPPLDHGRIRQRRDLRGTAPWVNFKGVSYILETSFTIWRRLARCFFHCDATNCCAEGFWVTFDPRISSSYCTHTTRPMDQVKAQKTRLLEKIPDVKKLSQLAIGTSLPQIH